MRERRKPRGVMETLVVSITACSIYWWNSDLICDCTYLTTPFITSFLVMCLHNCYPIGQYGTKTCHFKVQKLIIRAILIIFWYHLCTLQSHSFKWTILSCFFPKKCIFSKPIMLLCLLSSATSLLLSYYFIQVR